MKSLKSFQKINKNILGDIIIPTKSNTQTQMKMKNKI